MPHLFTSLLPQLVVAVRKALLFYAAPGNVLQHLLLHHPLCCDDEWEQRLHILMQLVQQLVGHEVAAQLPLWCACGGWQ